MIISLHRGKNPEVNGQARMRITKLIRLLATDSLVILMTGFLELTLFIGLVSSHSVSANRIANYSHALHKMGLTQSLGIGG